MVLHRTASITGRIIRPDGSAASNVQVQAAIRSISAMPLIEGRTRSQFDGRYEISGLPPGEYSVGAMNVAVPTRRTFDASADLEAERRAIAALSDVQWTWCPRRGRFGTRQCGHASRRRQRRGDRHLAHTGAAFQCVRSGVLARRHGGQEHHYRLRRPGRADPVSGWSPIPKGYSTLAGIAPGALTLLVRAETDQETLLGIGSTEVSVDAVEEVRVVVDRPGVIAGRIVYEGMCRSPHARRR